MAVDADADDDADDDADAPAVDLLCFLVVRRLDLHMDPGTFMPIDEGVSTMSTGYCSDSSVPASTVGRVNRLPSVTTCSDVCV